jgi:ketosteroid isomerase-like protein
VKDEAIMTPEAHAKLVLKYFDACNTGDVEQLKGTLAHDVVHCFLPPVHPSIRGAEHLENYWRKFKKMYGPTWKIDHTIASGDEVVSEWSCAYTLRSTGSRMMFRGTEWYVIKNQRSAEVRAYYQYDEIRDCQLNGFPYANRSHLQK